MFLSLFRIAIRNVTRNTKRSIITMTAIIVGCAVIVFARGFINSLHKGMIDGLTQTLTGDIQMHHKDYLQSTDALPLHLSMKIDSKLESILKSEKRLDAWSGRLRFTGILSNGLTTSLFIGNAIEPKKEYLVTPNQPQDIVSGGQPIKEEEPEGIVIADKLAKGMNLKVNDIVTLSASTKEGAINTVDVTVVGIRKIVTNLSGSEGKLVDIPLATAQKLLFMEGEITELVVNVPNHDDVPSVRANLQAAIDRDIPNEKIAVNDWRDVNKFFVDILDLQDIVLWIVIIVLFAVMVTGIVNTMLMAVMERIREIGTMMAIGVRRKRLVILFVFESVALGCIGACIGVFLGYLVVSWYGYVGISFKPAAYNKPLLLQPFVHSTDIIRVIVIAIFAALFSAFYPAYRASKLEPAEALRTL